MSKKKKTLSDARFDGEHYEGLERHSVSPRYAQSQKQYSDYMEEYNEESSEEVLSNLYLERLI